MEEVFGRDPSIYQHVLEEVFGRDLNTYQHVLEKVYGKDLSIRNCGGAHSCTTA